jgi:hypothetical protein
LANKFLQPIILIGGAVIASIIFTLLLPRATILLPRATIDKIEFQTRVMEVCGDTRFLWVPDPLDLTNSVDASPNNVPITHTAPMKMVSRGNGVLARFNGSPETHYALNQPGYSFGDGQRDYPFTLVSLARMISNDASGNLMSKYSSQISNPKAEWEWFVYGRNSSSDVAGNLVILLTHPNTEIWIGWRVEEKIRLGSLNLWGMTYDGSSSIDGIRQYKNGRLVRQWPFSNSEDKYIAMQPMGEPLRIGSNINTEGNPSDHWIGDRGFDLVCGRELSEEDMNEIKTLVNQYFGVSLD